MKCDHRMKSVTKPMSSQRILGVARTSTYNENLPKYGAMLDNPYKFHNQTCSRQSLWRW